MRNAPYIHQSHALILELWRTFPNVCLIDLKRVLEGIQNSKTFHRYIKDSLHGGHFETFQTTSPKPFQTVPTLCEPIIKETWIFGIAKTITL